MQQSYWIQVARSAEDLQQGKELVFDSKEVQSDQSVLVPYSGEPLQSKGVYYWRVKAITNQGATDWVMKHWSMAFLNDSDWKASWIGEDSISNPNETDQGNTRLAARYLRKSFENKAASQTRAVLYISDWDRMKLI